MSHGIVSRPNARGLAPLEYKDAAGGDGAPAPELKKLGDELKTTFEQFKQRLDAEKAEREKIGATSAETAEELKRINAALDEAEKKWQRMKTSAAWSKMDDAEKEKAEKSAEDKAFERFLRKGADKLTADEIKSLATDDDTQGGFVTRGEFANRIIQKLILVSPVREISAVQPVSGPFLEVPAEGALNFDAGWVGQRASRPETQAATLRAERIYAHELYAKPLVSQVMLEDAAVDVEAWMSGRVATRFAQLEGQAFLSGTGSGQPEGLLTNADIAAVNSGDASKILADSLIDLLFDLPSYYAAMATFILNRKTISAIRKLKDANGQYLWQPGGFSGPGYAAGEPASILGHPYREMPDMPDVAGNAFPVMCGAFREGYQIVDRVGVSVLRDPFSSKPFVEFYTRKRVGGQVVLAEAIRKLKISA